MSDAPDNLTLPTFLIAGAAKCGTTSLWAYLNQHPDVYMSPVKEVHFFDDEGEYAKGLGYYSRFFAGRRAERAVGEASPNYLNGGEITRRIRSHLPDARLVFIFRDPVRRAYSNYWHASMKGWHMPSFEDALHGDRFPAMRETSRYARYLQCYYDHFPREQILCLLTEQLAKEPDTLLPRLFEHVGVDPAFRPAEPSKRHNPAKAPRIRALQRLITACSPMRYTFTRDPETDLLVSRRHRRAFADVRRPLSSAMTRLNMRITKYPPLDEETARRLGALFAEDNRQLAEMTGLDVGAWWASA